MATELRADRLVAFAARVSPWRARLESTPFTCRRARIVAGLALLASRIVGDVAARGVFLAEIVRSDTLSEHEQQ